MLYSQEPKYNAVAGQIVNRATGNPIPSDEPVFILRAKDLHAISALRAYLQACTTHAHQEAIARRIDDFEAFAVAHPDRMKEPDTRPAVSEEEKHG